MRVVLLMVCALLGNAEGPRLETSVEILEPGDRRAKAIVNELILRGVEPARLVSTGALHPERSNDPAPIFLILKRSSD